MIVKKIKPVFKKGTVIRVSGSLFLVSKVVENRDARDRKFLEYFLVPKGFPKSVGFLVPEKTILKLGP